MALVVGIVLLAGLVLVASAVAGEDQRYAEADAAYPDDAGPTSAQPTAAQTREALESPDAPRLEEQAPDPEAAAELPHRDLGREEALELAEAVFGGRLKSSAGIFDELEPARYLSDYAAVLPSEGAQSGKPPTAAIVESSLPLRTEAADGSEEPVDLSLNSSEGELQPENPLIEVGIPHELGQGISIPGVGVSVELADAPADREATNVEGDFGFYPNVAENTDLVVAPVPTGVETFADIRSAEAPQSETFRLSMPPGASLEATPEGGAEVVSGAQTLVNVPAPIATDAAGAEVPVDLEVGGNSITLTTETSPDTAFPVLLDPAFLNEEFQWWLHHDSLSGWTGSTSAASYQPVPYAFFWGTNYPGPDLTSGFGGSAPSGTAATWVHTVPRYYQDINEFGTPPASYIHELFTEGLMFLTHGNTSSYPALITGLADPKNGWANYGTHFGTQGDLNSLTNHFQFLNVNEQTNEKLAEMALVTYEAEASAKLRDTYIGNAAVVVADTDAPTVTELRSPSQWMNATAVPIPYGFSDLGLGVRGAIITAPGESSSHPGWGRDFACAGTNVNPCPRSAKSTEPGRLPLNYNPAELPTGIDKLTVTVGDATWATGHVAAETVKVRVDHAAPALSLSGTLTEQGTLGTEKPQYTLKYSATDGTEEAPSFISAFGSEGTAAGQFKHPADVAVDSSSNVWVSDQNNNRIERQNSKGEFASFGALGSGNGQFKGPTGIEADSAGNVWVADTGNNRVEELNAKGEFLRAFGGFGSANGKLSAPQGIAIDSAGNVWVADTGNNRVEEFSSTGTFLGTFGSKGSEVGQLSEPTALDVGPGGNVWVADTGNNRIEEFSESGEFIAAYGTLGSGNGQFNHPDAIDVDTWGNVWVGDQANGRVEQFSERGEYLGKFGTSGTGAGQFSFSAPIGLASSYSGKLWVVDSGNNRVENWNAPQGLQSGVRSVSVKLDGKVVQEPKLGCETGGCPLAGEWVLPSGEYAAGTHWLEVTAADGVGLTTTSTQKVTLNPPPPSLAVSGTLTEQATLGMTLPRYNLKLSGATEEGTGAPPVAAPSYRSSFGTLGSGNGQLNHPGGLALDAAGNVWVADKNNNRIEEFNAKGEYKASIGASGSGNGQLNGPTDLTIDAQGNLWVADTGNARIEEFSAAGESLRAFGSIGAGTGQFAAPGPEGIA
ncbi:MAG TPA: NHL repeat-containing protein, partial [Solirubrobacterales bacterium]|nr:NHL repeat-containing protein [Solirubrobacterales bacterium]